MPRVICSDGHRRCWPPGMPAADAFDHFAWGLTPELADLVDRTQASFEELQVEPGGRRSQSTRGESADPAAGPAAAAAARPSCRAAATAAPHDPRRAHPPACRVNTLH